jgi:hypothetical protein
MEGTFEPEVELQEEEVASLAAILSHPGFKVYMKIWKSAVDGFAVPLINADLADEKKIIKLQMAAKVAAQLFTSVTNQVNEAVMMFTSTRTSDTPIDVAQNLDMGGLTTLTEEEPLF